jgi:hypothetical protein
MSNQPRESNAWPPPQERHPASPPFNLLPPEEKPAAAITKMITITIPSPQEEPTKPDNHQPLPLTPQSPWPPNLVNTIKTIVSKPCNRPNPPNFSFTFDMESAKKNYIILMKKHKGSLQCGLDANSSSPLGMGSEFRKIPTIKPLFWHHPIWPRMKQILTHGLHWPLDDLPEEQRIPNVCKAIEFSNPKGATNNPDLLRELVEKDVKYGYCIPPPPSIRQGSSQNCSLPQ